jgi:serine/threonine protein kinase
MKKLKGHRHIVTYIDSHASQLKGGGYEVFLLMEYCAGGGLIDFMNTRLQQRLTEPEILHMISDIADGVACMHYLKPPLLHRDLKVENVLISTSGSSRIYKLCDFGSTAPPRPAATSAAEGRLIEDDVQRHTTMQYRSPEMIDVYRRQPIDEKSDIWALGVLLYKLCYYTTPFEDQGQMAILNASFKFPTYPSFSDRIKKLICKAEIRPASGSLLTNAASMLREKPQSRPNIYQVVKEISSMRGTALKIKDARSPWSPPGLGLIHGRFIARDLHRKLEDMPDCLQLERMRRWPPLWACRKLHQPKCHRSSFLKLCRCDGADQRRCKRTSRSSPSLPALTRLPPLIQKTSTCDPQLWMASLPNFPPSTSFPSCTTRVQASNLHQLAQSQHQAPT